jgi:hypothetical protein
VLGQHIENARDTAKSGQFTGEIISAPFMLTNRNMNDGFRKIASLTDDDYKDYNITRKQLVNLCWKEYMRRFKIESYDFKRNKNIDNALKVVSRDIFLLTKESAKHIVFKGAQYNPVTNKIKLSFKNSRDLHSFIKENTIDSGEELTDKQLNLLIAIEMFNTIYKTKRLNLTDFLTKYYFERYNSIVLNVNTSKSRGQDYEKIISSITSFDNNNGSNGTIKEMLEQYKQSVSSFELNDEHNVLFQKSEDTSHRAEMNRKKELFKKLGGYYNELKKESEENSNQNQTGKQSIFKSREEIKEMEQSRFNDNEVSPTQSKQDDITDLPFKDKGEDVTDLPFEDNNKDIEESKEDVIKEDVIKEEVEEELPFINDNEKKEYKEDENKNRITEEETLEDITPEGDLKKMVDDMDIPVFTDNPTINNLAKLRDSIKNKNKES